MSTTDSMPIPSWSEVREALDAQRRRQEEQRKELSTINRLRGAGVVMMVLGLAGGAILLSVALADEHLDRLRHLTNPFATLLTVGGLVLFVASILYGANRRHHDDIAAKIAKLERSEREHAAGHARLERVEQLLAERDGDDAFVDALSEREDGHKTNGHNKVTRLVRPRSYDPDWPKRT